MLVSFHPNYFSKSCHGLFRSKKAVRGEKVCIFIQGTLKLKGLPFLNFRYKYRPQKQRKLYAVSSKTQLAKDNVSSTSLNSSSNTPLPNGHLTDDVSSNGKSDHVGTVSNGRDDMYINNGFALELTERLWSRAITIWWLALSWLHVIVTLADAASSWAVTMQNHSLTFLMSPSKHRCR